MAAANILMLSSDEHINGLVAVPVEVAGKGSRNGLRIVLTSIAPRANSRRDGGGTFAKNA